ncbi:MAG TPA: glycoside hydrolase family 97 protein [Chitinophagaceae bacterium]|nr:glycoside hydrolase family 97 protein [Chitinophagaceae bacterium]
MNPVSAIMTRKNGISILLFLFLPVILMAQSSVQTRMGRIGFTFLLDNKGTPTYAATYDGLPLIQPSTLGFILENNQDMSTGFEWTGTDSTSKDETWKPVWGEVNEIRNKYKEITVHLKQRSPARLLDISFRLFEDGLAFRYNFPAQPTLNYFIVTDELTHFNMAGDHKAFWIPGDYDSNEYPYTTSALSGINNKALVNRSTDIAVRTVTDSTSVQTPLMMKSRESLYINIHEAALLDYPAMQLHVDGATHQLTSNLVPDAVGNKAYLHAPFHTPWRTVIVSDKAVDILSSKMILNLNEPSKIKNTSWIRPMKFVGVWWEMQTGIGGWNYSTGADNKDANGQLIPSGKHSANTANVKRYIDFAARNNIGGVLVDGWNTGWEDWFGNWKENVFDFVTPYPDFNVAELQAYAEKNGVQLIMHNETSGSATNYERQMDTAFRFMKKFGYHSVKTGYVGRIIPRGEHHDGQWMVQHYTRVADKAASYEVMIDVHEPMRPTGLQRTYPNWMTSEAGRGNEFNAFSKGNEPEHETILPFTRLIGGPMDYTPGIFKLKYYTTDTSRQVHTTLAKQLALYITIYSPLQMAADLPQNYEAHPDAFQFIRDVPVDWDDTKIVEAEPGDYVTIARKEKGKPNWFIGAITDENSRTAVVPLTFLDKGAKYVATIYADGPGADWKLYPEKYTITKMNVDQSTRLTLRLAKGGGAAVSIVPAEVSGKSKRSTN